MEFNSNEPMDFDPDAHIDITLTDGRESRIDRNNSTLFTHLGELACFDHVFMQLDEDDEGLGVYVFRHQPAFDELVGFMIENLFPMRLNSTSVANCDRKAFKRSVARESKREAAALPDTVPEDW